MMYSDDTVIVNSEEVQGKIGAEVQLSLQRFWLRADVANAKQYLYDPMIDKINKIKTNTMNLIK
jgi:hypothetical protein